MSDLPAHPLQCLNQILAPIAEACVDRRREARERIDHSVAAYSRQIRQADHYQPDPPEVGPRTRPRLDNSGGKILWEDLLSNTLFPTHQLSIEPKLNNAVFQMPRES